MPFSLRDSVAVAIGLILFATLTVFALVTEVVQPRQVASDLAAQAEAGVREFATAVAASLVTADYAGERLTAWEHTTPRDSVAVAEPSLKSLLEGVADYVYVLDINGKTLYNSYAARRLPDTERFVMDSVVSTLPVGRQVGMVNGIAAAGAVLEGAGVKRITVGSRELLLFVVSLQVQPGGIARVVAGQVFYPPHVTPNSVAGPLAMFIPVVILIAAAAAGLITRMALRPVDERIAHLINEMEAVTDGRSLHKRLVFEADVGGQLRRLTDTLNAMIGRLETSFAGLRRFTADASHELKTPLTVLRADVERAMSTQGKRADQLEALEEALAETARMADLVESLLTLARADEGRFDLHREPVELDLLARDVFETATLLGEGTRITVRLSQVARATVLGDAGRLRQLFLNLVTNAIKYTPAGGQVTLSLSVVGDAAQFSVRDSGIGIASADLPHVFERFWRADRARSRVGERGGFGLGLAISQYIAHAHGGTLTVKSKLGRGSTFTAVLPLKPGDGVVSGTDSHFITS